MQFGNVPKLLAQVWWPANPLRPPLAALSADKPSPAKAGEDLLFVLGLPPLETGEDCDLAQVGDDFFSKQLDAGQPAVVAETQIEYQVIDTDGGELGGCLRHLIGGAGDQRTFNVGSRFEHA